MGQRGDGLKGCWEGVFRLVVGKSFSERVVKLCHGGCRGGGVTVLGGAQEEVGVVLRDVVSGRGGDGLTVALDHLGGLFQSR